MATPLNSEATNLINNSGLSAAGKSALTDAASHSDYFAGMLNTAGLRGGSLQLGAALGGTALGLDKNQPNTIIIDPNWVPGSGADNAESANRFATGIAHELGHFLISGGRSGDNSGATPDQAATNGGNAEGVALTAEYLVSKQLGMGTAGTQYMHSDNGQGHSDNGKALPVGT